MSAIFEALQSPLPAPSAPVDTGSPDAWRALEERVGTEFPGDYKEFTRVYGSGALELGAAKPYEYVWLLSPFSDNPNLALASQIKPMCDAYAVMKDAFPEDYPREIYPSEGGILPWALDESRLFFYWLTKGGTTDWTILLEYEGRECVYSQSTTEFLYRAIRGELHCDFLRDDFFTTARFRCYDQITFG